MQRHYQGLPKARERKRNGFAVRSYEMRPTCPMLEKTNALLKAVRHVQ